MRPSTRLDQQLGKQPTKTSTQTLASNRQRHKNVKEVKNNPNNLTNKNPKEMKKEVANLEQFFFSSSTCY